MAGRLEVGQRVDRRCVVPVELNPVVTGDGRVLRPLPALVHNSDRGR